MGGLPGNRLHITRPPLPRFRDRHGPDRDALRTAADWNGDVEHPGGRSPLRPERDARDHLQVSLPRWGGASRTNPVRDSWPGLGSWTGWAREGEVPSETRTVSLGDRKHSPMGLSGHQKRQRKMQTDRQTDRRVNRERDILHLQAHTHCSATTSCHCPSCGDSVGHACCPQI